MDKYLYIKDLFEKNKHQENAIKMSQYMKNQFLFYGIVAPQRKNLYKEFLKQEKRTRTIDWLFLDLCFLDDHREFQYLVYDYLLAIKKYLTYEDILTIQKYIQTKSWWDTVDIFSKIIGYIGLHDIRVGQLMIQWSTNPDMWLRRVAIIHQLGYKDKTSTDILKIIIINNLGSHDFFINKAIGWSLRNFSKTNPQWVKTFIEQYKKQMNKLSIKEGSHYII